ncbi:hypothetical protein [Novosphingopyxis sp.]|uniref:hypothetical protein n=1 Tax=Novosphingopyxis sp. TaxID=2709690 RepID=UPI003B58ED11
MRRLLTFRIALAASGLMVLGACASLGTNVSGSFACRAPQGSCAPTSAIDAAATGMDAGTAPQGAASAARDALHGVGAAPSRRMLKIVLAGYRDADGNEHEPRIVRVALDEPTWRDHAVPRSAREIARRLALDLAPYGEAATDPRTAETEPSPLADDAFDTTTPFSPLSGELFSPSQQSQAVPGPLLPGTEGPGMFPPRHDLAPHPDSGDPSFEGLPSIEAIEAAKARASQEKRP